MWHEVNLLYDNVRQLFSSYSSYDYEISLHPTKWLHYLFHVLLSLSARQTKHSACKSQFAVTSCPWMRCLKLCIYISKAHRNSFRFNPHRHNFSQSPFLFSFYVLYTSSKNIFSHTFRWLIVAMWVCVCVRNEREKRATSTAHCMMIKNFHIRPALLCYIEYLVYVDARSIFR